MKKITFSSIITFIGNFALCTTLFVMCVGFISLLEKSNIVLPNHWTTYIVYFGAGYLSYSIYRKLEL